MGPISKFVIVALAGFFLASSAPQSSAQDSATRDAAIHKCILEAQARFPDVTIASSQRGRTDTYTSCMVAAGERP
jgi:hypothetical protein